MHLPHLGAPPLVSPLARLLLLLCALGAASDRIDLSFTSGSTEAAVVPYGGAGSTTYFRLGDVGASSACSLAYVSTPASTRCTVQPVTRTP